MFALINLDYRFFLTSKLNREMLIESQSYATVATRLIVYKLRYQTFRFYFEFSKYAAVIVRTIQTLP